MTDEISVRRYTISIASTSSAALEKEAATLGIPITEYLAMIVEEKAAELLAKTDAPAARRLQAANEIKFKVAGISKGLELEQSVVPDHTLRVFQKVRDKYADLYCRATGCVTGFETGLPEKHALNLALGAISKRAARARVRLRPNGLPEKIRNITGEFCSSVTVLEPGDEQD